MIEFNETRPNDDALCNSLRLGNYLIHAKTNKVVQVKHIYNPLELNVTKISGKFTPGCGVCYIPLTEEWLEKLNFFFTQLSGDKTYKKYIHIFTGYRIRINVYKDYFWFVFNGETIRIKYIHQLQNIVFSLTGKEIILRTK